jgi:hypothetical protein
MNPLSRMSAFFYFRPGFWTTKGFLEAMGRVDVTGGSTKMC